MTHPTDPVPFTSSYIKSREIPLGPTAIGGEGFLVVAGPCAIESYDQFSQTANAVAQAGAGALRGGIFKMRTKPEAFQGLGFDAFDIVRRVARETGLPMISEVTDPRQIQDMGDVLDAFQVGARNMHNFELLKELGRQPKPVLLKRGLSAYLDEWLAAAEYITREGNPGVIFCERGIRSFERATRNTLDLSAVPYLKERSHLPVLVDPSHGTGVRNLIAPMSLAAAAAGADGLLIEVHPEPAKAASDGHQALDFAMFQSTMTGLRRILSAVDRPLRTHRAGRA